MDVRDQASLGAKKRDYWWTVLFTDPLALRIVRLLARRRWLTADQVSVVAILMGGAIGFIFGLGTRTAFVVGGVWFYLTFLVDCVDGKLARVVGSTSKKGRALDRLGDAVRRASASGGLVIGLWRSQGDPVVWWAVAYIVTAYIFMELSGAEAHDREDPDARSAIRQEGDSLWRRWSTTLGKHRLLPTPGMPDVQALVFIVGPVTGLIVPALALGIVMAAAGAGISTVRRVR